MGYITRATAYTKRNLVRVIGFPCVASTASLMSEGSRTHCRNPDPPTAWRIGPTMHRPLQPNYEFLSDWSTHHTLSAMARVTHGTSRKKNRGTGRPDMNRDTYHELKRGPTGRRSSNARHLGCIFQDMKPPKSILRKSSDMQKPIQRVKCTKAIARHTKIRDQTPSLGYICPGDPHQRSPNAPKFDDRSQEETEWQERWAREAAWRLAKSVFKIKEKNRATFLSPSENRCLPASTLKPEKRGFVVDSGASIHMISKKDLNDAEMDTLTKSCSLR